MSTVLLNSGEFESLGDSYILDLLPITGVSTVISYTDITVGETVSRKFNREFSYIKNNDPPTPYQSLTNTQLQGISLLPIDILVLRIKYTRVGPDTTGSLLWNEFILDNLQVQPCLILRTNRLNWSEVYGNDNKFIELNSQIRRFNNWAFSKYGIYLFMCDDIGVPETQIYLELIDDSVCSQKDLNLILKTLWGNFLVDYHFQIDIDLWDGLRS